MKCVMLFETYHLICLNFEIKFKILKISFKNFEIISWIFIGYKYILGKIFEIYIKCLLI